MKRGFTLVEIVVVLGIFGILMVVGTDFFVSTIQSSNRTTIQNEVRQNAQKIMQDMVSQIRQATTPPVIGTNQLTVGSVVYLVNTTDWSITKNGQKLNSNAVAVVNCGCVTSCSTSGLVLTPNSNGSISISLTVQQKPGPTRSDFCAISTLTDSATPRQY